MPGPKLLSARPSHETVSVPGITASTSMTTTFLLFAGRRRQRLLRGNSTNDACSHFNDREIANGGLAEFGSKTSSKPTSWLTLTGGVRLSHFSEAYTDGITENVASPRVGISLRDPKNRLGTSRVLWAFLPGSSADFPFRACAFGDLGN